MSTSSSMDSIEIIASNSSPKTPDHKVSPSSVHHTGYTPDKKKRKKTIDISPNMKHKIDDVHHYQQESLMLQCEMYYEQLQTDRNH